MKERKIAIELKVPITIFESLPIRKRTKELFDDAESTIRNRFDEIKDAIDLKELTYYSTKKLFEFYFYQEISNEAVRIAFSESSGKHNIVDNIMELLTEENLNRAIAGKTMIKACNKAISELPASRTLEYLLHGSKMGKLDRLFMKDE